MKKRVAIIVLSLLMALAWLGGEGTSGMAGEASSRGEGLEALSLVLELTPEQVKLAGEIIKAGEMAKNDLRGKIREKFGRLKEVIRSEAPKDSDIRVLCHEIAGLQEQLIYRDAQTQIAFRKILDTRQVEKLDRLEQIDSGVPGLGLRQGPGNWHRRREKKDD